MEQDKDVLHMKVVNKLNAFIGITVLFLITVYVDGMKDNWYSIGYLSIMYILFIVIGLYEIGRIELEKQEEDENRNNRKQDL
jgi:hypothetical protein